MVQGKEHEYQSNHYNYKGLSESKTNEQITEKNVNFLCNFRPNKQ